MSGSDAPRTTSARSGSVRRKPRALRRWWLESDRRVHVVGKGILRFHAVYWPAFLLSAGLPSRRIQVHLYLTVDGLKLSKSSGRTVDPLAVVDTFSARTLRWWFARDVGAVMIPITRRAGSWSC